MSALIVLLALGVLVMALGVLVLALGALFVVVLVLKVFLGSKINQSMII